MAEIDKVLIREVEIFSENDRDVYKALMNIYVPMFSRKIISGRFDKSKAPKGLELWYNNYVRPEMKKMHKYGFDPKLNPAERKFFTERVFKEIWSEHLSKIKPKTKLSGIAKTKRKLKK